MKIKIPEKFQFLFKPHRYKSIYGGRGSGKSHSVARALLMLGVMSGITILCAREFQNSIADSVHSLLSDIIREHDLTGFYDIKKQEIIGQSGTRFIFCGLKNISSLRSKEAIDICWIEEAQFLTKHSWNITYPTIRKNGSEIWFTWNPEKIEDIIYQISITNPRPGMKAVQVNWKDNPFFTDILRRELDYDFKVDPDAAAHKWGGEPLQYTDAQVFHGKWSVADFDLSGQDCEYYFGMDFGFSPDPSAIVRVAIYDNILYIDAAAGGRGIDYDDLHKIIDDVHYKGYPIYADSSRPDTISYLRRKGYPIRSVKKGKGSIEDGITYMRSFEKIVIRPQLKDVITEFKLYSRKVDPRSGDILPDIVDKHNHYIDSCRYALAKAWQGQGGGIDIGKLGL